MTASVIPVLLRSWQIVIVGAKNVRFLVVGRRIKRLCVVKEIAVGMVVMGVNGFARALMIAAITIASRLVCLPDFCRDLITHCSSRHRNVTLIRSRLFTARGLLTLLRIALAVALH
jgi:hypothetical protein